MKLTKIESETIISYNDEEDTVEIYTHNMKMINRIHLMCHRNPELYTITAKNQYGGITCIMPKKRLSVALTSPPTAECSRAMSERIKALNPLGLNFTINDRELKT